ncbi:MAG: LptE family protein [Candidatus Eisenbacteria bacterium]|nr:LptE family protein [Candidatus Eisenbacteria bacterium]
MEPDVHRPAPPHESGQAPLSDEAARSRARLVPFPASAVLLAALLATLACGYGLSARTNPHIRTIAVPLFQNDTLEKGIEEKLTADIIDVLQENRALTLTNERNADSVLLGKIIEYQRTPSSYDQSENVQEYKVTIILAVDYEDRVKRRTLWSEPRLLGWSTYFVVPTPGHEAEEEEDAQARAIRKLAEDIKTRTVEGW